MFYEKTHKWYVAFAEYRLFYRALAIVSRVFYEKTHTKKHSHTHTPVNVQHVHTPTHPWIYSVRKSKNALAIVSCVCYQKKTRHNMFIYMGCLQLLPSLKWYVSFAEYRLFYRALEIVSCVFFRICVFACYFSYVFFRVFFFGATRVSVCVGCQRVWCNLLHVVVWGGYG